MSNILFSVCHLFQFRVWSQRRNCHVILHQHATFHQYWITHGGDVTCYQFSRWWSLWRNFTYYRIGWRHFLQHTKYRQDNSIHGRDITISVLQKNKRLPYWNSSSSFDFDHIIIIRMIFCIKLPNFIYFSSHTRWELTTWAKFQLCLHRLLMSTGCKSSHNGFLDVSRSNGGLRISGWIG